MTVDISGFDLDLFLSAFVTLFVVIDAPGVAPIFVGLTQGGPGPWRAYMAVKGVAVASIILLLFGFGGEWLLTKMAVSLDAFRAAGGVLLFLIALDMVFEKRTERREQRADALKAHHDQTPEREDISVFPLGIPMIAGPGSIAAIMLFMSKEQGDVLGQAAVLAALGANLILCLLVFLAAGPLVRMMGATVASTITRIFGVVLCALAAQLVIDGIRGAFQLGG